MDLEWIDFSVLSKEDREAGRCFSDFQIDFEGAILRHTKGLSECAQAGMGEDGIYRQINLVEKIRNRSIKNVRYSYLRGADLSNLDIWRVDLSGADLRSADLTGSVIGLEGVYLEGARGRFYLQEGLTETGVFSYKEINESVQKGLRELEGIILSPLYPQTSEFSLSRISDFNLKNARFCYYKFDNKDIGEGNDFSNTIFSKCTFVGTRFSTYPLKDKSNNLLVMNTTFYGCDFEDTNFVGLNGEGGIRFEGKTNFRGANFSDMDLRGFVFDGDSYNNDFMGAKMNRAKFKGAVLNRVRFKGAGLEGADFEGCDVGSCVFYMAGLRGASFKGAINVPDSIKKNLDENGVYRI